jgi:hypothetical protein
MCFSKLLSVVDNTASKTRNPLFCEKLEDTKYENKRY